VAASASSAFLAFKSVQNGLKGVHLVSVHKSAAKSCIIEKNSSFAKGPARTPRTAREYAYTRRRRRDFLVANNFSRPADKCNVALYFINKGAVDELYEIIYGRCFLYRAHEWKSLSRGT
jgi:hypothetical protein